LFSATNASDIADRITRYMAHEIVRRERIEAALVEPGRMARLGAELAPSGAAMGVVIAAFAIGILTGAAGLVVAVLLSAPG
jgi:hypothetical protein